MSTQLDDLDAATLALADVSVALTSLYPVLTVTTGVPSEARSFIEDGIEALALARRHLNALRSLMDTGEHSVGVPR